MLHLPARGGGSSGDTHTAGTVEPLAPEVGGIGDEMGAGLHLAAVFIKVMAVAAVGTGDEEEDIYTAGESLQLAGAVGHAVANGVIGHKVGILWQVRLDIGDEKLVFFAALGGLGIEADRTGKVDILKVIGSAGDNCRPVGLSRKTHHFGMAWFPKDDYLASHTLHFVISLADALLESQHDGAGCINKMDAEFLGSKIGGRGLTVGPDKDLSTRELRQTLVVNNLEAKVSEAFHFGVVVNNVTEAIEAAVAR